MGTWQTIDNALRRINWVLATLGALLLFGMNVVVVFDVIMRYAFNNATVWADDIARYTLVYVIFFGIALALHDGVHVSVDVFLELFDQRTVRILRLIGFVVVAAFGAVLTWQTAVITIDAIRLNWVSSSLLAVPMKLVYPAGTIGSLLFTLTAVSMGVRFALSPRIAEASVPRSEY